MGTAIRKHFRDFVAIALLLRRRRSAPRYVIVQNQRLRIPVLEERPFELKAEFETAQAVVPGQGQTLRVAGVKVGDVEKVELEDGVAVVTFGVDRDYLPVYKDATMLLRPQTGLKDMFFEMDPGTERGRRDRGGRHGPRSRTPLPTSTSTRCSTALDSDTQAYLRLLLVGAGQGLDGRGKDLGKVLGSLGPITKDLDAINSQGRRAQGQPAPPDHQLQPADQGGRQQRAEPDRPRRRSSNTAIGAIAEQDPSVQRAIQLLPGTLEQSTITLNNVAAFADQLGPAFDDLRPVRPQPRRGQRLDQEAGADDDAGDQEPDPARSCAPRASRSRTSTRPPSRLAKATPKLTVVGKKINRLGNMAAYNPNGAEPPGTPNRDEGYLFWAAWLGHNSELRLPGPGRPRRRPPDLPDDRLRRGAQPARLEPAGAGRHRPAASCSRPAGRSRGLLMLMQKSAPSVGRILIAVGLRALVLRPAALPLGRLRRPGAAQASKSYRITAYFPEATQLAVESDVRIGGVSVGKVKSLELAPDRQADQRPGHDRGRDRDRARVRADLERRPGDPARRRRCSARPTSS